MLRSGESPGGGVLSFNMRQLQKNPSPLEISLKSVEQKQKEFERQHLYLKRDELGAVISAMGQYITNNQLSEKGKIKAEEIATRLSLPCPTLEEYVISSFVLFKTDSFSQEALILVTSTNILQDLYANNEKEKICRAYDNCNKKENKLYVGVLLSLLAIERACGIKRIEHDADKNKYFAPELDGLGNFEEK